MHHRRLNHRRHRHGQQQLYEEKGELQLPDPSPAALPDMPGSSSSLKKHAYARLMRHHRTMENNHALQAVSPASYGSSIEIGTYNHAMSPSSSIELKGRVGETSYSLKTSTQLLKVLNRIWSLEEQHVSSISLVKSLKKELDHARLRIKDLVREQNADRREMDELSKQITEGKLARKNREQDRVNTTIQFMRDELDDERKLRKRSESLHQKLARELYEVKTVLGCVTKDLEKERKSCNLLEDLCDEFALGIKDYEKELHAFGQKLNKDNHDKLILHVSESWLDERAQWKLEHGRRDLGKKGSTVDKLRSEIEALMQMRKNGIQMSNGNRGPRDPTHRRNSLESIPLNLAVSVPRDEDDSAEGDSNCFELGKTSESNKMPTQKHAKKTFGISERASSLNPTSLQVKFEEQMSQAISNCENKADSAEAGRENSSERKHDSGLNSNYVIDNLIRNHYLFSENANSQPDKDNQATTSVWRIHPSLIRQWTEKLPSHDLNISEPSSNLAPDLKENTLKAKLLEARESNQRELSRLKASINPSVSK